MTKRNFPVSAFLALVCILALSAAGRAAGWPYIGLYTDEAHSIDRQDITTPYTVFDVWVWALPSTFSLKCAGFKLSAPLYTPGWLVPLALAVNPDTSATLGDPLFDSDGIILCFADCKSDWVWLVRIRMLAAAANLPGYIEIVEYTASHGKSPLVSNCTCGYPIENPRILNKLGLNQDAVIGVRESSWGAIKSMYRRR